MSNDKQSPAVTISRRGLMLVLSSPSGAGKSTISRALLEKNSGLSMSVSATTRPMRTGETEGEDYFFVDQEKFDAMAAAGEFLEHATVFENSYGTPKGPLVDVQRRVVARVALGPHARVLLA